MDSLLETLLDLLTDFVKRRHGLVAAWIAGLALLLLTVVGIWVAWKLLA